MPDVIPSEQIVQDVLREWDPEGLIEMGLPANEYNPEAERICNRLPEVESAEQMTSLLQGVFSQMFSRDYALEECEEPGNEIFRRLPSGEAS